MSTQEEDRSLFPKQPGHGREEADPAMQPRAPRTMTILLVGRIIGATADNLCRIRNISEGGLMAEVRSAFAVGEAVRIVLRNGNMAPGQVRWVRDGAIGIQFDAPLDVEKFLADPGSQKGKAGPVSRAPRLPADAVGEIRFAGRVERVTVTDLSQGGAGIATDLPIAEGTILTLTIAGLNPIRGAVRWVGDGRMGIGFLEPVAFATLAGWLDDPVLRYGNDDEG